LKTTFPFYKQPDAKDCGPTCLRIIAKHYGKLISLQEIREYSPSATEKNKQAHLEELKAAVLRHHPLG